MVINTFKRADQCTKDVEIYKIMNIYEYKSNVQCLFHDNNIFVICIYYCYCNPPLFRSQPSLIMTGDLAGVTESAIIETYNVYKNILDF